MTHPTPPQALADSLDTRQKVFLLGSLMITLFLAALDQTIVSTATPRILADLGGFNLLSWLFTSYLLASTVVVPLVGKLGDIYGRKVFLIGGIVLFVVSSWLCGLAPNIESLIAFRALQGLGGGTIMASVFATTGDLFTPAERGRYMGLFTGVFSLASVIGPTFGGYLTDNAGWRWVFYVNVPIAAVALPAIWRNLPSIDTNRRPQIDYVGAALLSIASITLLLALEWAGDEYAWSSPQIVGLFAVAAVMTAVFVAQERRHPEPILPLHLFTNRAFIGTCLVVFTLGMAMFGGISYLPTFVQTGLETSATASGIVTTPQSLGLFVVSVFSGQLLTRTGRYKFMAVTGTIIIAFAMILLANVTIDMPKWQIGTYMVLLGAGIGFVMPTMGVASQNAVDYKDLGVATSANQFFRQIGAVLGVALFGVVLSNSYGDAFQDNLPADVREEVPSGVLVAFDNPTVALDERSFANLQQQVLEGENGESNLAALTLAVRESIGAATRDVFLIAAGVAILTVVFAVALKELPLRRTMQRVSPPAPTQAEGGQPPPPAVTEGETQAPSASPGG